jgi:hypothetical protein
MIVVFGVDNLSKAAKVLDEMPARNPHSPDLGGFPAHP